MNENVKEIIKRILADEEATKMLRELLLDSKENANAKQEDSMYVYCVCKHTAEDNVAWYHPVVDAASMDLFNADTYQMYADKNQFEVEKKYGHRAEMIRYLGNDCRMVVVPMSKYQQMEASLRSLMQKIIDAVNEASASFEKLAALTHSKAERFKTSLMMEALRGMDTLYDCFNEEFTIVDGSDHEYAEDQEPEYDGDCDNCDDCDCDCDCNGDCDNCNCDGDCNNCGNN